MLTEIVDGVVVQLSAADEAAVRAQWASDDVTKAQYNQTQSYLDQRNRALSNDVGQLMTLLYNDLTAGAALNSGTFYNAIQAINKQFPQPAATPVSG